MTDTPHKTLSLKKKAPTSRTPQDSGPENRRQRSGARARQAALQDHAQQARGIEPASPAVPPISRERRPGVPKPAPKPFHKTAEPRTRRTPEPPHRAPASDTPSVDTEHSPRIERKPRAPRTPRIAETFSLFAPCPHGLEEALSLELQALGYDKVRAGRAGCHFEADWMGVMRANLYSRLATRILVQVAQASIHTEDDILALAHETEWERWFGPEQTLRVDTSAIRSPVKSLQYCNLRVKDGICDRLREREGARPDIDTVRPDARVHLFLDETSATLYLDVSGESLFKRGWRLDKGEAPLRENLAAGLLALSGWTPEAPLLDPFCGSGTILIEAAWIALGVPPGIWRPFSFERLRPHDARLWRHLKDDARAHIATRLEQPLVGCDLQSAAIAAARSNAERAHLGSEAIRFEVCDARQLPAPDSHGWIVTNPPYGERLSDDDVELWPQWATWLKRHYDGWRLNIITSDLELPKQLRLKAQRRTPLHNGALDCRLFQFELVGASYRNPPSAASVAKAPHPSQE
ncbi:MAG TPA: THUMP domain-containing protein [Castellaniella sp.]|uniref:THUMP domain-containing class I SAM-dependent RNA methyltransferase n=1 Tax=Castellaniella sp. TaxID=1955812 RepID=UPI002EEA6620